MGNFCCQYDSRVVNYDCKVLHKTDANKYFGLFDCDTFETVSIIYSAEWLRNIFKSVNALA